MITFVVGQRGVGKSTFLSRVQGYYTEVGIECVVVDVDREIEIEQGQSIHQIFADKGLQGFREVEAATVKRLGEEYKNHSGSVYIALGAGYAGPFTDPSQVLWLRRPTDRDGRIFFDRPKLDSELSHFDDYMSRYTEREYKYLQTADEQLMMMEGLSDSKKYETVFLGFPGHRAWGCLTLFPKDLRKFSGPESFIGRRLHWEIDRFEVRADILEDNLIRYVLGVVPKNKLLLSFRQPHKTFLSNISLAGVLFDWPFEKGPCPYPGPGVYSLHTRQDSLMDSLLKFEESAPKDFHLKLAVEIETWSELLDGHLWWKEDPLNRTFLPTSKTGRWRWYRALFGRQMKMSFFREGAGSSPDQPYLSEWIMAMPHFTAFAAVLGQPVYHSLSPSFHRSFFEERKMPFVSITLDEENFDDQVEVLKKLGLHAAAVTAPFKKQAYSLAGVASRDAEEFKSVNTLVWNEEKNEWHGHNTDFEGLEAYLEPIAGLGLRESELVIWGGGGTLTPLKEVFPKSVSYSARQSKPHDGEGEADSPRALIWAVGRSRQENCKWPPEDWKIEMVIDLNYTMDSPGREYALKTGAKYINGEKMFELQAKLQQKIWQEAKL